MISIRQTIQAQVLRNMIDKQSKKRTKVAIADSKFKLMDISEAEPTGVIITASESKWETTPHAQPVNDCSDMEYVNETDWAKYDAASAAWNNEDMTVAGPSSKVVPSSQPTQNYSLGKCWTSLTCILLYYV